MSLPAILAATSADESAQLSGIAGWVVDVMEAIGAPGAGLLVALENLFPPLPSEVILPLAGFTASQGNFSLGGAIFWTTLGSVVGEPDGDGPAAGATGRVKVDSPVLVVIVTGEGTNPPR